MLIYEPEGAPVPSSLLISSGFKLVQKTASTRLVQLLSDIPTILDSAVLTDNVLRLPFPALLDLLSSDLLTSNSEDSVLMLVSWWLEDAMRAQRGCDAQQLLQLQGVIRYSRLSSTYMAQALCFLPRFCPTAAQINELNQFQKYSPNQRVMFCKNMKTVCPAGWYKPQRPLSTSRDHETVSLTLFVTTAQLRVYLAEVKMYEEGGRTPRQLSTAVLFKGFSIHLALGCQKKQDTVGVDKGYVYVYVRARLPKINSMVDLHPGFPGSFTLSIDSNVPGSPLYTLSASSRFMGRGYGWTDFAKNASQLPGNSSDLAWWDSFIIDGHVRFTAVVNDESPA